MSIEKKLQIRNSTAEFLIFTRQAGEDGIEVRVADETVWLTQKLMAALFDVDVRTVSEHLGNLIGSGELKGEAVVRKFRTTASDGKNYNTQFYNLDAIIAVGFRVNSTRAIQFRQWATGVLRDFAIRGYVLDKLRNTGSCKTGYLNLTSTAMSKRLCKAVAPEPAPLFEVDSVTPCFVIAIDCRMAARHPSAPCSESEIESAIGWRRQPQHSLRAASPSP